MKKLLLIIGLNISLSAVALPPDMQADRYLLQVEKALQGKDKDYKKAVEVMDKIIALKDQHNLQMPIEFYFKYAKITLKGDGKQKANKAYTAINHYLQTAGRQGEHYVEALNLYDQSLFLRLGEAKTANEVKELIELGADVNAVNKNGKKILSSYINYNNMSDSDKVKVRYWLNNPSLLR
ncbi:MAG: hypothetical protein HFP77_05985 [Methylococcales symbiont of Iophon sp. n. MRB-2018]|nr:MAG: hypothetical protein HFP77_05985 [Methylococcales symbiont of Iophon sp. n. MRB-2018]KAF3979220.1 MAG: hypothetical protein HFP76_08070 [Methylococcales symbiont of Iophon sp. n. MRB-2018]